MTLGEERGQHRGTVAPLARPHAHAGPLLQFGEGRPAVGERRVELAPRDLLAATDGGIGPAQLVLKARGGEERPEGRFEAPRPDEATATGRLDAGE